MLESVLMLLRSRELGEDGSPLTDAELAELGTVVSAARELAEGDTSKKADEIRSAAEEAVRVLATHALPMAEEAAQRWARRGFDLTAALSAAQLVVLNSVRTWDPTLGALDQYLSFHLNKSRLGNELRREVGASRLPHRTAEPAGWVVRTADALTVELGRTPTNREIAARTGLSPREVIRFRAAMMMQRADPLPSLDPEDDADMSNFEARFGLTEDGEPEEAAEIAEAVALLRRVVGTFDDTKQRVLVTLFGLDTGHASTLTDTAEEFGWTDKQVARLRQDFVARLQHPQYLQQRRGDPS